MSGNPEVTAYAAWTNRDGEPRLAWVRLEEWSGSDSHRWRIVQVVPLIPSGPHAAVRRGVFVGAYASASFKVSYGYQVVKLYETIDEAIEAMSQKVDGAVQEYRTRGARFLDRGRRSLDYGEYLARVAVALPDHFRAAADELVLLRQGRLSDAEVDRG